MCAKNSGELTCPASSRRFASFQAGSILRNTPGTGAASYQPTPNPSPLVVSRPSAAGFLTYREAVEAGPQPPGTARRRFFVYQPGRIDWWATAVQQAGTVFFNVSTGVALSADLSAQAAHRHVWRPDAFGSVAFLVASALAWFEACPGWAAWHPRSWSWRITLLNLTGSVAFGVRRGRLHQPVHRPDPQAELINLGTFMALHSVRVTRGKVAASNPFPRRVRAFLISGEGAGTSVSVGGSQGLGATCGRYYAAMSR